MQDNITVETSTDCNAKCIICPNGQQKRPHYLMPLTEFENILKFFKDLKHFVLCGMFEPLMDPRLDKILSTVERLQPLAGITVFTNGSLLTGEKTIMLLTHPHFRNLVVSIHGFTKKTYESVMGLDRDTVYTNVLNFVSFAGYNPEVHVSVSFVRVKQNVHELEDYRKFWNRKVDEVSDFECINWRGAVDSKKLLYSQPQFTRPCPMFEQPLVIDAYGQVVRCCYDFSYNYGHVLHGGYENWLAKERVSQTYPSNDCKQCLGWRHY